MKYFSFLMLFITTTVNANIYVVVNENSPIQVSAVDEIADVYLGRRKSVGDTYIDQVLDRTGEDRRLFFEKVTNMRISQVNAYWAKLKFSGSMRAPEEVDSRQELLDKLANNPQAIGYMREAPPEDSGLRVALQIDE